MKNQKKIKIKEKINFLLFPSLKQKMIFFYLLNKNKKLNNFSHNFKIKNLSKYKMKVRQVKKVWNKVLRKNKKNKY